LGSQEEKPNHLFEQEAGRIIVDAVRQGKREEIFTQVGKIGTWLNFFAPELYDIAVRRKISCETKRA